MPNTSGQIAPRLQEGDRVFVIQEVYTATSLQVSATSNLTLAANVGGSPVNNKCDSSGQQGGGQQSGGQGVSVGVCRDTDAELSFTSQTPIPFAVRLNEVQVGPGGFLQVKLENFHLPNLALGSEDDVAATVVIDPQNPTITELEHITH